MTGTIRIFGDHDERTIAQLERCAIHGDAPAAVLCADGHVGYSQPIGGVVAYEGQVSPSGVGYDIACGNKAVLTTLTLSDLDDEGGSFLPGIAAEIQARISFGVGRKNDEPVDHQVLDEIRDAPFEPQRDLYELAARQLGTVGAGNHYVDLFADEQDSIWVGVHFGSRGFGHKTASGFLALAQGADFHDKGREGEMDAPPTLFATDSELGQSYIEAMELAGRYAYAGRDVVCDKVLEILGAGALEEVHNHHNFAWRETHDGRDVWVVRKGATPAFPGQRGFVGSTMGEESVILRGVESETSAGALYSTIHGAGRAMSRTQAAGKQGTVMECTDRDCDFRVSRGQYVDAKQKQGLPQHAQITLCPDHPDGRMQKRRVRVKPGLIDYDRVRVQLAERAIELRGGAADEAPDAYKRLPDVLAHHAGTVEVVHRLRPLVVVMAGEGTIDPYKD